MQEPQLVTAEEANGVAPGRSDALEEAMTELAKSMDTLVQVVTMMVPTFAASVEKEDVEQ